MGATKENEPKTKEKHRPDTLFWESLEILRDQHWISESFTGRGDLSFKGKLRFSGKWTGDLASADPDAHLFIMSDGKLTGKIKVATLSVEGQLTDVEIDVQNLHVFAGAKITGKVKAKNMVIDEGAVIQGQLMGGAVQAPR